QIVELRLLRLRAIGDGLSLDRQGSVRLTIFEQPRPVRREHPRIGRREHEGSFGELEPARRVSEPLVELGDHQELARGRGHFTTHNAKSQSFLLPMKSSSEAAEQTLCPYTCFASFPTCRALKSREKVEQTAATSWRPQSSTLRRPRNRTAPKHARIQ